MPKPGKAALAPMLSPEGRMKGDLKFELGEGPLVIMGSYYQWPAHMRWFSQYAETGVEVRDLGEEWAGFSLAGPKSKQVIEQLTDGDIGQLVLWDAGRLISVCCAPVLAVCLWLESWAMRLTAGWAIILPCATAAGGRVQSEYPRIWL